MPDIDVYAAVVALAIVMTLILQALPAAWLAGRLGLLDGGPRAGRRDAVAPDAGRSPQGRGYDPRVSPWRRRRRAPRERLGHERPGAVLRGPPITLTCECGERAELPYGEAWSCPSCGRRYDTARIPQEDYERIRRTQLRFRILPVAYGLFVSASPCSSSSPATSSASSSCCRSR